MTKNGYFAVNFIDLIKYTFISAAELYLGDSNFGLQSKTSALSTVDLMKLCVLKLIYCVERNKLGL